MAAAARKTDRVLFQEAMNAMKHSRYGDARRLLKTLIRTYPDSNYVPRAKLSIGNAWHAQGAFAQAVVEYRDFVTFFPSRPEVPQTKQRIRLIEKEHQI